jgi:predicted nuclease of predicted toxin-antitoxin system
MTLWLDAHFSHRLAPWLSTQFGLKVKTLRELGLRDADDLEIFMAARRANAVILTKDEDFALLVTRLSPPPQILWFVGGNTSNAEVQAMFLRYFTDIESHLAAGESLIRIGDL